ncbi:MAG: ATP-dependent DNA helicase RecQ [Phycisphaerales bacterium]|nr:ATP-dependent DNA helicase RecQ [Phycisphaerales bacterium]
MSGMSIDQQLTEGINTRIRAEVERVWGYDELRPMQMRAIIAGVEGRDCLTVLPTGGGKSLCYQVPPLITGKATIVISPLIALMRDQVRGLELQGYKAAAMHSGLELEETKDIARQLVTGELDLVLAAPERVVTPSFKTLIGVLCEQDRLGSIAIDEAHCISQWGHDFRPEYRRISELREVAPGVAMQAFTATATPRVREDIVKQLGLRNPEVMIGTFDRPNLTYRIQARENAAHQIAAAVGRHASAGDGGGTIVYCLSRKDTEKIADELRGLGLDADAYHAGLGVSDRHNIEQAFSNETLDIVVATVAFGMGIDRSNVRLVVHASMPKSIEAYQQETGRAGRDGLDAECLLLYAPSDGGRWERLIEMNANESGIDPSAQIQLVRDMRRFVASFTCRHKYLSEHFGQEYTPPDGQDHCGACDVCLGETAPEEDSKRIGQIILSAVARTGQRYGASHICDVVRGGETQRIKEYGHDNLRVHGMLKHRRKAEVMSFIDQLIAAEALTRVVDDRFETLAFGDCGVNVMKGLEPIELAKPIGTGSEKSERNRRTRASRVVSRRPMNEDEKALFESLRNLRKSIAEERGVPPYVVFNDSTLVEMALNKPNNRHELLGIRGIGQKKLDEFGRTFLDAIERHLAGASTYES